MFEFRSSYWYKYNQDRAKPSYDINIQGFYNGRWPRITAREALVALNDEFRLFMQTHRQIAIISFYDTHTFYLPTSGSPGFKEGPLTKKAVELSVPGEECCMLATDFLNLVRHDSPTSASYLTVRDKLKVLVQELREDWNATNGLGKVTGMPIRQTEKPNSMHDSDSGSRRR